MDVSVLYCNKRRVLYQVEVKDGRCIERMNEFCTIIKEYSVLPCLCPFLVPFIRPSAWVHSAGWQGENMSKVTKYFAWGVCWKDGDRGLSYSSFFFHPFSRFLLLPFWSLIFRGILFSHLWSRLILNSCVRKFLVNYPPETEFERNPVQRKWSRGWEKWFREGWRFESCSEEEVKRMWRRKRNAWRRQRKMTIKDEVNKKGW